MHSAQVAPDDTVGKGPYPPSIENAVGPELAQQVVERGAFSSLAALCPVGVFDSGMGGLSVLAELRKVLPHEDFLYFGDSGNCPYGGRPDEWLRARSLEIADFLLDQGAKAIVVACNAASAAGLEHLRALRQVPIIGLVPAVKPAVGATRTGTIGVLATKAALRGQLLTDVIDRFATPAQVDVVPVAPVGLVEAVERGDLESPETAEAIRAAVTPMIESGADAIVLGCTHYPFLKPLIRQIAGDEVQLIDSGEGVARQTWRVLAARHLLRPPDYDGTLAVYTSGDVDAVRPVVWRLVGEEVPVLSAGASS